MSSLWRLQANAVFDTDKNQAYLDIYDAILGPLRGLPVRILELGVHRAGSLKLWASYFPNGTVYGFDLDPPPLDEDPRVQVARGDQASAANLQAAMDQWGVDCFDVIVDDAAHIGHLAAASFSVLFERHLRPGGLYFLEDWGTGYWPDWPDGEPVADLASRLQEFACAPRYPAYEKDQGDHRIGSHTAGMVGLVKLLVDVLAAGDISHHNAGFQLPQARISKISIEPGVVAITKAF